MTETIRLLRDLVALPSINPMGRSELDMRTGCSSSKHTVPFADTLFEHRVTNYLEKFFHDLGVACYRQPVAPMRDNMVAHCKLPGARHTLMLEVHQDTVPVEGMTIDPFGAVIENGRLHGRGACDVKGGMAAMLTAFARAVREQPRGAANVILACTVDEEHTFTGVRQLVESGLRADAAIVAEPTQLDIVHAHKGVVRWHLSTSGRSCHSSTPEQGINAIYRMGRLLTAIAAYAERLQRERVDPLLGPATLSVGRIEGGTSVNTVPDRCRIEIDRRLIPGEDPRAAPIELKTYLIQEAGIDFPFDCSEPWMMSMALAAGNSTDLVARLGQAIDAVRGSHRVMAVPFSTDAAALAEAGIPTVVFGPGDIAKAHTSDEWVPVDEVCQASEILYQLICAKY